MSAKKRSRSGGRVTPKGTRPRTASHESSDAATRPAALTGKRGHGTNRPDEAHTKSTTLKGASPSNFRSGHRGS